MNIKKTFFALLFCIIFSLQGLLANIQLKNNLLELTQSLETLNAELQQINPTKKPASGKSQLIDAEINVEQFSTPAFNQLDPELKQIVFLQLIPSEITTPEEFITIAQTLTNIASTNKKNHDLLYNALYMKPILEALFKATTSEIANQVNKLLEKKRTTLLPFINSILLFLFDNNVYGSQYILTSQIYKEEHKVIDVLITQVLKNHIDPNLLNEKNNFLQRALMFDKPDMVKILIKNGVDINKPIYNRSGVKTAPFILAIERSPRSALMLLEQKNLNYDDITKQAKSIRIPLAVFSNLGNSDSLTILLFKLLKKNLIQINDLESIVRLNVGWPALSKAIMFYRYSKNRSLKLIKFLLEKGADPKEEYYGSPGGHQSEKTADTPLRDAQDVENNAELLELLKQYEK